MALKDAPRCTAKSKSTQRRCENPAVSGYNVCRHHGAGNKDNPNQSAIKHGRYSRFKSIAIASLIAEYEADSDPLNIMPELAAARALFQDFTDRYDEWRDAFIIWSKSYQSSDAAKPTQVLDIADAYKMVSEITKIVERIEKIKASNAISRPELMRVLTEMSRVVESFVREPATLEEIKKAWLGIKI